MNCKTLLSIIRNCFSHDVIVVLGKLYLSANMVAEECCISLTTDLLNEILYARYLPRRSVFFSEGSVVATLLKSC